jgi:hypothetical protein
MGLERELFAKADLVTTGGYSLYDAKREQHGNVHAFPSSVDREHLAQARNMTDGDEPADQAAIEHPRLGFYGVIDERMDLEMLGEVAAKRPDWALVMVGPVVKIDPAALPQAPNIHYLGGKSYAELPRYLAGWDVAADAVRGERGDQVHQPDQDARVSVGGCRWSPLRSRTWSAASPAGRRGHCAHGRRIRRRLRRRSGVARRGVGLAEEPTSCWPSTLG